MISASTQERRTPFKRFSTLPTIAGGAEVIDLDGRPVAHRDSLASATGTAYRYNLANAHGSLPYVLGVRSYDP